MPSYINCGQFEGYEVEVVAVDESKQTVRLSMVVFGRPVPLTFSFAQAAELLDRGPASPSASE